MIFVSSIVVPMKHSSLLVSFYIFLIVFHHSIIELNSLSTSMIDDHQQHAGVESLRKHAFNFILCQRAEQYPWKLRKKFCSEQSQDKQQQQPTRGKRVGWTISI